MTTVTLTNVSSIDVTLLNAINNNNTALTTALANSLATTGTGSQMQQNLDMNSNRVLNLPAAISLNEPLRLQDLNNFIGGNLTFNPLPTGGATNSILAKNSGANYDVVWLTPGSNVTVSAGSFNTVQNPNFTTSVTTPSLTVGAMSAITNTASLTANVNAFSSSLSGAATASGGGTTNYLRADNTWQNPVANSPVLLNMIVASNSASLTDTTSFTGTYSGYEIVFFNLVPQSICTIQAQVQSGGTFQNTSYNTSIGVITNAAISESNLTTGVPISPVGGNIITPGTSGSIRIYNVASTSVAKNMHGTSCTLISGNSFTDTCIFTGHWNSTNAITGFQIICTTGNILSGTMKVYGIP